MALSCHFGHAMRGKARNVYIHLVDGDLPSQRWKIPICGNHLLEFVDELGMHAEPNGDTARGPFIEVKCHWGNHDFTDGWSRGAVFVMVYPGGSERQAYRALLCETCLPKVAPELRLGAPDGAREAL